MRSVCSSCPEFTLRPPLALLPDLASSYSFDKPVDVTDAFCPNFAGRFGGGDRRCATRELLDVSKLAYAWPDSRAPHLLKAVGDSSWKEVKFSGCFGGIPFLFVVRV